MPTIRKKAPPRQGKTLRLTDAWLDHLKHGQIMLDGHAEEIRQSGVDAKEMWETHKEKVLKSYLSPGGGCYGSPGERPWAWWRYEKNMVKPHNDIFKTDGSKTSFGESQLLKELGLLSNWEVEEVEKSAKIFLGLFYDDNRCEKWPYYDEKRSESV